MKLIQSSFFVRLFLLFLTAFSLTGCRAPDITFGSDIEGPVSAGTTVTLNWNVGLLPAAVVSSHRVSIVADDGETFSDLPLTGTLEVLLTEDRVFTLTASQVVLGFRQTGEKTLELEVAAPPEIVIFEVDNDTVQSGQNVTLNWLLSGAIETVALTPNSAGEITAQQNEVTLRVFENTDFVLSVAGPGGVVEASASVDVFRTPLDELTLDDSNLENCIRDMATEQGIEYLEDIREVICPGKQIASLGELIQLVNLEVVDLADNYIEWVDDELQLEFLTELNLSNNIIDRLDPFNFHPQAQLERLNLASNHLTGLEGISDLVGQFPQLKALDWSNNGIGTSWEIAGLLAGDESQLEELRLDNTGIVDLPPLPASLKILSARGNRLMHTPYLHIDTQLVYLDLSDNLLQDFYVPDNGRQLETLIIGQNPRMNFEFLDNILESAENLKHLDLEGICLGADQRDFIDYIDSLGNQESNPMVSLNLNDTCIDEGVLSVLNSQNLPNLEEIRMASAQIKYPPNLDWSKIKVVDFSNTLVHENDLSILSDSPLIELQLDGIILDDGHRLNQLLASSTLSGLEVLSLNNLDIDELSQFGSGGLRKLDLSHVENSLQKLSLAYNNFVFTPDLYAFPALTHLDISHNPLMEGGLRFHDDARLKALNISNTAIQDIEWTEFLEFTLEELAAVDVNHQPYPYDYPPVRFTPISEIAGLLRKLSSLHISHYSLDSLELSNEQMQRLTKLSVRNDLSFSGVLDQLGDRLVELDVSHGRSQHLFEASVLPLKKLVARNIEARSFNGVDHPEMLTHLDLSENPQLNMSWPSSSQSFANLQYLNFNGTPGLVQSTSGESVSQNIIGSCQNGRSLRELYLDGALLEYLDLSCLERLNALSVRDSMLEVISMPHRIEQMRYIDVANNPNLYADFVFGMRQLSYLDISHTEKFGPAWDGFLGAFPYLTSLGVGGHPRLLESIMSFGDATVSAQLVALDLNNTSWGYSEIHFSNFSRLKKLNVSGLGIDRLYLNNYLLRELDISNNPVTTLSGIYWSPTALKSVNLNNTLVSHDEFSDLFGGQGFVFKELHIAGLNWRPGDAIDTLDSINSPHLVREIDVSGHEIYGYSFDDFNYLEYLNVSGTEAVRDIYTLPHTLRELHANDLIGGEISFDIGALENLVSLSVNFTDVHASQFEFLLNNNARLVDLHIEGGNREDLNLALLNGRQWRSLNLNGLNINGQLQFLENGVRVLKVAGAQLNELSLLASQDWVTQLDISGNQIEDLTPIDRLRYLSDLNVSGNPVSLGQVKEAISNDSLLRALRADDISANEFEEIALPRVEVLSLNRLNNLDELVVSGGLYLKELYANGNNLELFEVGNLDNIEVFEANDNNLSSITSLPLEQLKTLKLARNPLLNLEELWGGIGRGNFEQLEVLDVSGHAEIQVAAGLGLDQSRITELYIADTSLFDLSSIRENRLSLLDVTNLNSDCDHLQSIIYYSQLPMQIIGADHCTDLVYKEPSEFPGP